MTDLLSWMPLEIGRDLGWTLIHFLWQGLLLAALLNAILPICRSAVARHNCALATLGLMALAPIATFLFLHDFVSSGAFAQSTHRSVGIAHCCTWIWGRLVMLWLAGVAGLEPARLGGWYLVPEDPCGAAMHAGGARRASSSAATLACSAGWRWRGRFASCCRAASMCRW